MNKLKSCLLVETPKQNKYFFDRKKKKTILCHPLLYFLLKFIEEGKDIQRWIDELPEDPVKIEGYGACSKKELEYYYRKYLILKANGHFDVFDQEKQLSARFKPADIEESLANSRQVTLEVTDRCNLQCEYCGYGKFYNDYDKRNNEDMDISTAVRLLNFLQKLWDSSLNRSHDRNIHIGIYGGEPLLNFSFIKKLVAYSTQLKLKHNHLSFAITTNGLLIEKYMDFLVENDFNLLISLDGNAANNKYRVFKNGKPAFKRILENIRALQANHPGYFEKKVNFNAVLHNKNSVSEIFSFFRREFDKIPRISALNTSGIRENQREAFRETYANITESLYNSEDYSFIEKEMFIGLPNIRDVSLFLLKNNDFSFDNYNQLLYSVEDQVRFPTGTCIPFSRKVFVTVNGKILACERVGHQFMLGRVDPNSVKIDYKSIADRYNAWHDKLRKQCAACYNTNHCTQCIFNLNLKENNPGCKGFMTYTDYSRHLGFYLDFIEKRPGIYRETFAKVLVG